MAGETVLSITGIGVPPYSARGLSQTLQLIDAAADFRRTVNGELINTADPIFRKYRSTITCNDNDAPAFDGLAKGTQVVVDCVYELGYPTATGSPQRPVVPGSVRVEGDFTYYRPRLSMTVTDFDATADEYGGQTSWRLDLEET